MPVSFFLFKPPEGTASVDLDDAHQESEASRSGFRRIQSMEDLRSLHLGTGFLGVLPNCSVAELPAAVARFVDGLVEETVESPEDHTAYTHVLSLTVSMDYQNRVVSDEEHVTLLSSFLAPCVGALKR